MTNMTEQKNQSAKKSEPTFFEKEELNLLRYSLLSKWDEKNSQAVGRVLELDQQEDGICVNRKLKALLVTEKGKDGIEEKIFKKGGAIDFTTTEKALLLDLLKRPWGAEDAEQYMNVKEKLS